MYGGSDSNSQLRDLIMVDYFIFDGYRLHNQANKEQHCNAFLFIINMCTTLHSKNSLLTITYTVYYANYVKLLR